MPGFAAEDSLYRSSQHYATSSSVMSAACLVVPQAQLQISTGLTGSVPWPWCRAACDYCRTYGWYCWPCFICAIILADSPTGGAGGLVIT